MDIWEKLNAIDRRWIYVLMFISILIPTIFVVKFPIELSPEAVKEIEIRKKSEEQSKNKGNISIDLRKSPNDSKYLSMGHLANLVDKRAPIKEACLSRDANEYKPIRDALMHTALLTGEAKQKMTTVYENIKGRIKKILAT